jgi:hypothetical protein
MSYSVIINEPTIGLTDRTAYVDIGDAGESQTFDLQLGQRGTGTLVFIIRAGDSYQPTVGCPIYLYQGSQCVFAGTIDSVEYTWLGNQGDFNATLTLVSLEQVFDALLIPPRSYIAQTAGYIVADLLATVCAGVPVTAGTISAGPIVAIVTYAWDSVSSAFDALTTLAGMVWRVDPSTQTLEFSIPSLTPAPFAVDEDNTIYESMDWLRTRQDFRNRQVARLTFAAFPPSNSVFGPGSLTYAVNWPIDNIQEAFLTDAVRAAVTWTMHSNPTPGDTVTVGSAVYTWVAVLDNTAEFNILIGATTGDCSLHLQHAINADPNYAGVDFSLPTWENGLFNGGETSSPSTTAWVKVPGSDGNSYPVDSSNPASLSWATPTATGGTNGSFNTSLQVGLDGTTGNDLTYTVGSPTVTLLVAPLSYLCVVYWRLGGDCIAVQDDVLVAARALIEHGTGKYQMLTDDSQETSVQNGLTFARAALTSYSDLPITFYFYTDTPNLRPGLWLALSYAGPMATLLNGNWLIQEVTATLVPSYTWRYQVYVVNATVVNYLNFWLNLMGDGGSATAGSSGVGGGGVGLSYQAVPMSSALNMTSAAPAPVANTILSVRLAQPTTGMPYAVTWGANYDNTAPDIPQILSVACTVLFVMDSTSNLWTLAAMPVIG